MAIFARRVLQRMLFANARCTTAAQRQRQALALDRADAASLATEWEVAVLYGLSACLSVVHEPDLAGRRPDVLACSCAPGAAGLFVADIATVYETGRDQANPVERLTDLINDRARRLGLGPGGFDLRVEGAMQGEGRDRVMLLRLPPAAALDAFVQVRVLPFLRQCAADPGDQRELSLDDDTACFTLLYNPGTTLSGRSHPSYTTAYSLTRNPVANTLKRKLRQLKATGTPLPLGVFLCAADASVQDAGGGGGTFGTRQIVNALFAQHTSLAFVCALWTTDRWSRHPGEVRQVLHLNPRAARPLAPEALEALGRLPILIPAPSNSGLNALYELEFPRWRSGRYFYGSWSMSRSEVKISARTLLGLLSGRESQAEFLERHGGDSGLVTLFEQKVRQGQLITDVSVESVPDQDDDWVVFRFGPPDPAVAPFRASPVVEST